jgi:hypothetical protein
MSTLIADRVSRTRISDPQPTRCAGCLQSAGPTVRFVDFDCFINRGVIVEEGSMAIVDSIDTLHLCESCVREAAETLDYKAGLHAQHLRLNRQLVAEVDQLRDQNKTLRQLLAGETDE